MKKVITKVLCLCLLFMNFNVAYGRQVIENNTTILQETDLNQSVKNDEVPFYLEVSSIEDEQIVAELCVEDVNYEKFDIVVITKYQNNELVEEKRINYIEETDNSLSYLKQDEIHNIEIRVFNNQEEIECYEGQIFIGKNNQIGDKIALNELKKYIIGKATILENTHRIKESASQIVTPQAYSVTSSAKLVVDVGDIMDIGWNLRDGEPNISKIVLDVGVENHGPEDLEGGFNIDVNVLENYRSYRVRVSQDIPADDSCWLLVELNDVQPFFSQYQVVISPIDRKYMPVGYENGFQAWGDIPSGYFYRAQCDLEDYMDSYVEVKHIDTRCEGWSTDLNGEKYVENMFIGLELYNRSNVSIEDGLWIYLKISNGEYIEKYITEPLSAMKKIHVEIPLSNVKVENLSADVNISAPVINVKVASSNLKFYISKGSDMVLKTTGEIEDIVWNIKEGEVYVENVSVPLTLSNEGGEEINGFSLSVTTDDNSKNSYWIKIPQVISSDEEYTFVIDIPNLNIDIKQLNIMAYDIDGSIESDMEDNSVSIQVDLNNESVIKTLFTEPRNIVWGEKDGKVYAKQLTVDGMISNTGIKAIENDLILQVKRKVNGIWDISNVQTFEINNSINVNSTSKIDFILDWVDVDTESIEITAYNKKNIPLGKKFELPIEIIMTPEGNPFDEDNKILYQRLSNGKHIYFEYDVDGNLLRKWIR